MTPDNLLMKTTLPSVLPRQSGPGKIHEVILVVILLSD